MGVISGAEAQKNVTLAEELAIGPVIVILGPEAGGVVDQEMEGDATYATSLGIWHAIAKIERGEAVAGAGVLDAIEVGAGAPGVIEAEAEVPGVIGAGAGAPGAIEAGAEALGAIGAGARAPSATGAGARALLSAAEVAADLRANQGKAGTIEAPAPRRQRMGVPALPQRMEAEDQDHAVLSLASNFFVNSLTTTVLFPFVHEVYREFYWREYEEPCLARPSNR